MFDPNTVARVRLLFVVLTGSIAVGVAGVEAGEFGDPDKGRGLFRACAACHTLVPGRHRTGPSLAKVWGKKAGTIEGFRRYSEALKQAEITWDEHTLDQWLENSKALVPKNRMKFRGTADGKQRRDLIAFLRQVSEAGDGASGRKAGTKPSGMMGRGKMPNLKQLQANNRVATISHCGDTYTVTTEDRAARQFWEFNLRLKTDSSGPVAGHPVIIPAGMRGDRASVIFAVPAEISPFIEKGC